MITKARRRLYDSDVMRDFRYRKYQRPEHSSSRARFVLLAAFILLAAIIVSV